MKKIRLLYCSIVLLAAMPAFINAQDNAAQADEKHKAEAKATAMDKSKAEGMAQMAVASTPIKVQVVFIEYEGDKKIKSLPYVLNVNAPHAARLQPGPTKIRIGSRVPVFTNKEGGMQYLDVGTNIDARSARGSDDRFILELILERSWVEGDVQVPAAGSPNKSEETSALVFRQPIIRQFRSDLDLSLRDGQTVEGTMATDPLSGKVLRVEVTLNVTK